MSNDRYLVTRCSQKMYDEIKDFDAPPISPGADIEEKVRYLIKVGLRVSKNDVNDNNIDIVNASKNFKHNKMNNRFDEPEPYDHKSLNDCKMTHCPICNKSWIESKI